VAKIGIQTTAMRMTRPNAAATTEGASSNLPIFQLDFFTLAFFTVVRRVSTARTFRLIPLRAGIA